MEANMFYAETRPSYDPDMTVDAFGEPFDRIEEARQEREERRAERRECRSARHPHHEKVSR